MILSPARTFRIFTQSRIARLIFASNLAGILVLVVGSLVLNEMRVGLIKARKDSLATQGNLIVSVLAQGATVGDPEPALEGQRARRILKRLELPSTVSARLYDRQGNLVGDYALLSDKVKDQALPDIEKPNPFTSAANGISNTIDSVSRSLQSRAGKSLFQPRSGSR